MVNLAKNLYIGFSMGLITWIFLFYAQPIPEIVTVDIASITETFIKQEAQKNLSSKERQRKVARFSHQLEVALEELSHTHKHMVIFSKEAVLKGAKNYTTQVRTLMHLES